MSTWVTWRRRPQNVRQPSSHWVTITKRRSGTSISKNKIWRKSLTKRNKVCTKPLVLFYFSEIFLYLYEQQEYMYYHFDSVFSEENFFFMMIALNQMFSYLCPARSRTINVSLLIIWIYIFHEHNIHCSTSKPPVWKTKYSKENNRRVIRTSGIQGIFFES